MYDERKFVVLFIIILTTEYNKILKHYKSYEYSDSVVTAKIIHCKAFYGFLPLATPSPVEL